MIPISKIVTQEFSHELKAISYIINTQNVAKQIRVSIYENDNFVNDVECKNLHDAKVKVQKYIKNKICPFYY